MTAATLTPHAAETNAANEQRHQNAVLAHHAIGKLLDLVPLETDISDWRITSGRVESMCGPHNTDDDTKRAAMRKLAKALDGFAYTETKHSATQNMISVSGEVDGVKVRFWNLVKPCLCGCYHSGGAA